MVVAYFFHADTLAAATLEHGRALTYIFCGDEQVEFNCHMT